MRRIERLLAIALFLGARRRVLAREVAATFGVSLRTVYRDVRALIAAGFPVEGTAGDGYRLTQEAYLRPLALTSDEAEALAIASRALSISARSTLREALARATTKLEASLDPATRRQVRELQARIVVPDEPRRLEAPTTQMLNSVRDRQVVRLTYDDPKTRRRSQRSVEPLGFVCRGDSWWLVGWCRLRGDARAFRVDGIATWASTSETFAVREGASFSDIVARDRHLAATLFGC